MHHSAFRMVVLDEADQLFHGNFREDITFLLNKMPLRRQTMFFSASMSDELAAGMAQFTRTPQVLRLSADEPSLIGVQQFEAEIPSETPLPQV